MSHLTVNEYHGTCCSWSNFQIFLNKKPEYRCHLLYTLAISILLGGLLIAAAINNGATLIPTRTILAVDLFMVTFLVTSIFHIAYTIHLIYSDYNRDFIENKKN